MRKWLLKDIYLWNSLSFLDSSHFSLINHRFSLLLNLRLELFLVLNCWVSGAEVMMLVERHKIAFFCWFFLEFIFLVALVLCEIMRDDNVLSLLLMMDVIIGVSASVGRSFRVLFKLIYEHAIVIDVGMRSAPSLSLWSLSPYWKI